jgi:glutamate-5-semialdehyde dehydrogenase
MKLLFEQVRKASRSLPLLKAETINRVLLDVADAAETTIEQLLQENEKDLAAMDLQDPKYDRLKLTPERIKSIAADIRQVVDLPYPIGKTLSTRTLPNGLELSKVTVPLGVIGIVYEARPNVTFDVFSLCLKSGNACLLKGGSDAAHSNKAIVDLIKNVIRMHGLDEAIVQLLPPDRSAIDDMLQAVGYVDVIIPRGGQALINYVRSHAKVPVIETGAGIVHTYFDESGNITTGKSIIHNAKTRRVSVCNALDCLLIHQNRLDDITDLLAPLATEEVQIFADDPAYHHLEGYYPQHLLARAQPEHYGTEFLALKMSVKTVASLDDALEHIADYSSRHSEAIIAEDRYVIERFLQAVDAAAVYVNTSTAFTDGAQFGLGAEIGISTQKLHARGPMALEELTSYKWIVKGNGQIRGK